MMDGRQEAIVLHVLQLQGRSSSPKEPGLDYDWTTAINIRFQRTQAVDNVLSAGRHGEKPFASVSVMATMVRCCPTSPRPRADTSLGHFNA